MLICEKTMLVSWGGINEAFLGSSALYMCYNWLMCNGRNNNTKASVIHQHICFLKGVTFLNSTIVSKWIKKTHTNCKIGMQPLLCVQYSVYFMK